MNNTSSGAENFFRYSAATSSLRWPFSKVTIGTFSCLANCSICAMNALGETEQLNKQLEAMNCVELGCSSRLDESCGDGCGIPPSARPRWKCRFHIRCCPAL